MHERPYVPSRSELATLGLCLAAGALGALPGAAGAFDPIALLAWCTLLAPAAGALCGARGLALPVALAVPVLWSLAWMALSGRAPRAFVTPHWAALAVLGLFAAGHALGRRSASGWRAAGLLVLAGLLASGASLGFGLLAPGSALARTRPALARTLLELSPLTLVFDCAGWDWTHAHPDVYASSGSEWFPRRPRPGNLAGPTVLVVGCALSGLAGLRGKARPRR